MSQNAIPQEKRAPHKSGMLLLLVVLVGLFSSISCIVLGAIRLESAAYVIGGILLAVGVVGEAAT